MELLSAEVSSTIHRNENHDVSSLKSPTGKYNRTIESNLTITEDDDTNSEDDEAPKILKKRVQRFSESDSDINENININHESQNHQIASFSNIQNSGTNTFESPQRRRIREAFTDSDSSDTKVIKNEEQQKRMKNKKNKMRDKFKSLHLTRVKNQPQTTVENESTENINKESSDNSDEVSSIENIKKKIKERMSFKPSICDPDTSDEENSHQKDIYKKKKGRKSTKPTSPKPLRMTHKEAMENMKKIKSESNRMLREQEVSLPYHRPKALSLKDIMSRRKPAVTLDGKALPIKMNQEQLKHYALLLEERQKEMIELCKSDTEGEENDENTIGNKEILPETDENKVTPQEIIACSNHCDNSPEAQPTDETNIVEAIVFTEESKLANNDPNVQMPEAEISESNMNTEKYSNTATEIVKVVNSEEDEIFNNKTNSEKSAVEELLEKHDSKTITEPESQLTSLHYDTEKELIDENGAHGLFHNNTHNLTEIEEDKGEIDNNCFLDEDINMEDIDAIIENAEIIKNINTEHCKNSPMLIRDQPLNLKPKLTGAPGMVIDLDGSDPFAPKKPSGVELLKERFNFFAKLKRPEEMERDRERKLKPGRQHIKLKQELEEQIAEQRSLEWAKRLEEEKHQQMELNALRSDASDAEDDIEKIEAKLEENNEITKENTSESEEEDICDIKDKPRKQNPMIADEAEESDCDEFEEGDDQEDDEPVNEQNDGDISESDEESSEQDSSESEDETQSKTKRGRILKAFVDSDDEDTTNKEIDLGSVAKISNDINDNTDNMAVVSEVATQDDDLQLAQRHKSVSDDLFTSQESALIVSNIKEKSTENQDQLINDDKELGTQTFSILDSTASKKDNIESVLHCSGKLSVVCETQPYYDDNLNAVAAMCSGNFSQNLVPSQLPMTQTSQSQPIGEDILALCTGKFYDNEFISQVQENDDVISQESSAHDNYSDDEADKEIIKSISIDDSIEKTDNNKSITEDGHVLKSILDELHNSEFDSPKPNKFFCGDKTAWKKENNQNIDNSQLKKKFTIESEDETNDVDVKTEQRKTKKLKKRKLQKRALQISDDEESEESELEENEEYMTDVEDGEEETERTVEYDSEENEIDLQPQNLKKKRKMADFFEQEAELTSEDEWVGSGDEDEAGLDRMEREAGDDDTFNQGKLQKELGQIHMRDVLDQDKREVRLIQELLFEDGDLGDGHRQRKFRWRNTDGEGETGTTIDEFGDTQEEEFESEEQWRKQRHEREVFLRQMQNKDEPEENLNARINRTAMIKANLCSKTMSSLLLEVNTPNPEKVISVDTEKKISKDIPSPKKPFTILQQNYHGSLLTRGRGALARLAALATPLATDDDAPKVGSLASTSRRNFVFAALTPKDDKPKVTKRKLENNADTPKLVKKMKTADGQKFSKNSLLSYIKL